MMNLLLQHHKDQLPQYIFIHGDIKLENILHDEWYSNCYLHDLDTAFLKTHDDILQNEINFQMDHTVIYTHPLFYFFINEFLPLNRDAKQRLGVKHNKVKDAISYWDRFTDVQIIHNKFGRLFKAHILELLEIPEGKHDHYDAQINKTFLMKKVCKQIDLHAFNSSVLYSAILKSAKPNPDKDALESIKSIARKNIKELNNVRMTDAKTKTYNIDDVQLTDAEIEAAYYLAKIKTLIIKNYPVESLENSPVESLENNPKCSQIRGLHQISGTCWFNAALNGIVLGEHSSKIFKHLTAVTVNRMSKEERAKFAMADLELAKTSCPILSQRYILIYLTHIFCAQLEFDDRDHAKQIMKLMKINYKPLIFIEAGFAIDALKKVLLFFFNKRQVLYTKYIPYYKTTIKKNVNELTYLIIKRTPYSNDIKFIYNYNINDVEFVFDHAVMAIHWAGHITYHYIICYKCGNIEYIYDSILPHIIEFNWSNTTNAISFLTKMYSTIVKKVAFEYCSYVRSDRIPINTRYALCTSNIDIQINTKSKNEKVAFFYIFGLGCSPDDKDQKLFKQEISITANIPEADIFLKCNNSYKDMAFNVIKTTCQMTLKNNEFVVHVIAEILKQLQQNRRVYVYGQSYGGSVASRVAEYFNDVIQYIDKIVIRTYGSIYISKLEDVHLIDIKHYVFEHDICLKCLSASRLKKAASTITLMKSDIVYKPTLTGRFKLYGDNERWDIHNSYEKVVEKDLKEISKRNLP